MYFCTRFEKIDRPHSTKSRVGASCKNVRGLAQLVAHTSGGREVAGSSPVAPTKEKDWQYSFDTVSPFV